MKKFLGLLTALFMAMSLCVFAACGENEGKKDDPVHEFTAVCSEESYASEEDAVKAILEEELSGDAYRMTCKKFDRKSTLSEKELKKINTEGLKNEKVVSGHTVLVTYEKSGENALVSAPSESKTEFTVKILEFEKEGSKDHVYRYYLEDPDLDGMLTKTYFDGIFDPKKYLNCTQKMKSECKTELKTALGSQTTNVSMEMVLKMAQDKADLRMSATIPGITENDEAGVYVEKKDSGLEIWISSNGKTYQKATEKELKELESEITIFDEEVFEKPVESPFDFTYFEKSDKGLKIREEYEKDIMRELLQETGLVAPKIEGSADMEIILEDGLLKNMSISLDASADFGEGRFAAVTIRITQENGEFGTTKVERPSEVS